MSKHIFISYSRKDSACVLRVARQLEAQGYKVWIDVDSIPGGDDWRLKILEGLSEASVTLVFWSHDAAQSPHVKQEYEQAIGEATHHPSANKRIIPVLFEPLSQNPLPKLLDGKNAVKMLHCSKNEIDALIREIARDKTLKYRQFLPFDFNKPAGEQESSQNLEKLPDLVSIPFSQSVHCHAEIITNAETKLADILALPDDERIIQVYLHFMFGVGDEHSIRQVYQTIEKINTQREAEKKPPLPFFMLHVTGPDDGTNYSLGDSEDGFWQGQWLDSVNTIHEALTRLVGQNGAAIQLFNAVPSSLNFAIGMQFFKYWHLHLYHHTRDRRYQFVLDTADL